MPSNMNNNQQPILVHGKNNISTKTKSFINNNNHHQPCRKASHFVSDVGGNAKEDLNGGKTSGMVTIDTESFKGVDGEEMMHILESRETKDGTVSNVSISWFLFILSVQISTNKLIHIFHSCP